MCFRELKQFLFVRAPSSLVLLIFYYEAAILDIVAIEVIMCYYRHTVLFSRGKLSNVLKVGSCSASVKEK